MDRVLRFDRGTLLLEGFPAGEIPPGFTFDPRVGMPRAPAIRYHDVVLDLHRRKVPYRDEARGYAPLQRPHQSDRMPRPYQRAAVEAWRAAGRRGVVVLPTGAGKSFVAELCIADADRSALIVAPTIDLVGQWYDQLKRAFGEPIGILGGGAHEVHDITVSTYDSAWLHVERYGNRFGLIVFDEVHHLPGPSYAMAAEGAIAPFRLGLTATLERPDGEQDRVLSLVGPVVHRLEITELSGEFLSEYRTEVLEVHLSAEDRAAYDRARATFRAFVEERGIRMSGAGGWQQFLRQAASSKAGRQAFKAWRESRRILEGADAKLRLLEELLRLHHHSRVIVFTNDNATVHEISRRLLIPAITHQTDIRERRALLDAFKDGSLPALVTSRVLNEGVDLPGADVGIVLSGTQTVREHVQRLGRILRKQEGKQAVLYELVVADSVEQRTSQRRRDHVAYRR
jgi:superfamily II DNA or RNA helicase